MKCRELQVGDWITDNTGFQLQITAVGDDYAYATFEGNEADSWELDDKDDQPEPIPITYEILKKNGWKDSGYCIEYKDGKSIIQCVLPIMRGRINGIVIEDFKCEYVHQLQQVLRLAGMTDMANNFKI